MMVNYGTAGTDYNAAYGTNNAHVFSSEPGAQIFCRSNYLGMGGYYAPSQASGIQGVFTWKSRVNLGAISAADGTSNTIMFGEYAGGYITWSGGGGLPDGVDGGSSSVGFNYSGFNTPVNGAKDIMTPGGAGWYSFGSMHAGGVVNMAMCDGSVQHISSSIDFSTWVYLTGYADGVVVTFP
jgi:prepilin-type processing-associated H-X9-DG protein